MRSKKSRVKGVDVDLGTAEFVLSRSNARKAYLLSTSKQRSLTLDKDKGIMDTKILTFSNDVAVLNRHANPH